MEESLKHKNPEGIEKPSLYQQMLDASKDIKIPQGDRANVPLATGMGPTPNIDKYRRLLGNDPNLRYSAHPSFMETVASNQSAGELIGKSLIHTAAELVGGTIEGFGALFNPSAWAAMWSNSHEKYQKTMLQELGNYLNQGIKDALPIYMTQKAQQGFAPGDATWWAAMFPTTASMASAFIPAGAALRAAKMLGKSLNIGKSLGTLGKHAKLGMLLETGAGAMMSRHIDSYREAAHTFDEQRARMLDLGYNMDEANKIAGVMASNAQRLGWANLAFDVAEWNALLRTGNRLRRGLAQGVSKELGRKGASKIVTDAAAKASKQTPLWKDLLTTTISEGLDEAMIGFYQKEGVRIGEIRNNMTPDGGNFLDRFANHFGDRHTWDEMFWGAFGGLTMGAGRPAFSRLVHSKQMRGQEDAMANHIMGRAEKMTATLKNVETAIKEGNIHEAKALQSELAAHLVSGSVSDGSLEIWLEMLDNMANLSTEELTELGLESDIKSSLAAIKQSILNAEKKFMAYSGVDHSDKKNTYTQEENDFINRTMAHYDFLIDEHTTILNELKTERSSTKLEQIQALKDKLSDVESARKLAKAVVDKKITHKELSEQLYPSDSASQAYLSNLSESASLNRGINTLKQQIAILLLQEKALLAAIDSYGDTRIDKAEKAERTNQLNIVRLLINNANELITRDESTIADLEAQKDVLKKELSENVISEVEGLNATINDIVDDSIETAINTISNKIKMYKSELGSYANKNKLHKKMELLRQEAKEAEAELIQTANDEIMAADTEAEVDAVIAKYPGLDLRDSAKKAKADIKKRGKIDEDAKTISLDKQKRYYSDLYDSVDSSIAGIKDAARAELYKQRLEEIKNANKTTVEEYQKAITDLNLLLQDVKDSYAAQAVKKEPSIAKRSLQDATIDDIISDKQRGIKSIEILIKVLDGFAKSDINIRAIQDAFPHLSKEELRSMYGTFIQIQENAIFLLNKLKEIEPLLHEKLLIGEELYKIASTMAHLKSFATILHPHVSDFSSTDFGKLLVADVKIQEELKVLSSVLYLTYKRVEGFENFNVELTPAQDQALGSLFRTLTDFKYGYEFLKNEDVGKTDEDADAAKATEILPNSVEGVLNAINNYIKAFVGNDAKNVSFNQLAELVYSATKSTDATLRILQLAKDFYNYVHSNNIPNVVIASEEVTTEINEEFFGILSKGELDANLFHHVTHKEGVTLSFEMFTPNPDGTFTIEDPKLLKKFETFLNLKQGDRVFVRKNKDGRLELYKGNTGLGIFVDDSYTDRKGLIYKDANGVYHSYIDNFNVGLLGDYNLLLNYFNTIREIWLEDKGNKTFESLPTEHEFVAFVIKAINANRAKDAQLSRKDVTAEMVRHIIAPIFYGINRKAIELYTPTIERLEVNYARQNARMKANFEIAQTLEAQVKENNNRLEMYVSSLSLGQTVYLNQTRERATYNRMEQEGNLRNKVQGGKGKITLGVRNFTNNSAVVVDIRTGEPIVARNSKAISEGSFEFSDFFVTHEAHGQTMMLAVTRTLAFNSKAVDETANKYGQKLMDLTLKNLEGFLRGTLSVKEFETFVTKYFGITNPGQDTVYAGVKSLKDGGRQFQIRVGEDADRVTPLYFAIIVNPDRTIHYGLSSKMVGDLVSLSKGDRTVLEINQFKKAETYIRDRVLPKLRRGILIGKNAQGNSIISSALLSEDGTIKDDVTGKVYNGVEGYIDFLIDTGALSTELDGVRKADGEVISNFNPSGRPRATMSIDFVNPFQLATDRENASKKSITQKKIESGIETQEKVVDSYSDLDGKTMTLDEFLRQFELTEDGIYGTLIGKHYGFVLQAINGLFKGSIKIKFNLSHESVQDSEGRTVRVLADYKDGQINIYDAFFKSLDGTIKFNEDTTLAMVHELLHDVYEGVRQQILSRTNGQEKMDSIEKSLIDFVNDLEKQLNSDTTLSDPTNTIKIRTADGSIKEMPLASVVRNYIDRVRNADPKVAWQEVITYPFADLSVAQALNKIITPADEAKKLSKSNFFNRLLDKIVEILNDIFKFNIDVNKDSRLQQVADLASTIGQFADISTQGKLSPSERTSKDSKAYALSDEVLQNTPAKLFDAISSGNYTATQWQIFVNTYGGNFIALRDAAQPKSLIQEWNELPGKVIAGIKVFNSTNVNTYNRLKSMFPDGTFSETMDRGSRIYRIAIRKPADDGAKSTEIIPIEHNNPSYNQKFNARERRSLDGLYTRIIIDDFIEAVHNTTDVENNPSVNPDFKIPSVSDFMNSGTSIRSYLRTKLESLKSVKGANVALIEKAIADLSDNKGSESFAHFTMYFSRYFGAQIIDVEAMAESDNGMLTDKTLTKNWDETAQLMLDPRDNITSMVKYHLAKLSRATNTLSGLTEAIDVNDIWYEIHSNLQDKNITKENVISTLFEMGKNKAWFNDIATYLDTDVNPDFTAGFISMAKLSILEVYALTNQVLSGSEAIDFALQNRGSWAGFIIYDEILRNLRTMVDSNQTDDIVALYEQLYNEMDLLFSTVQTPSRKAKKSLFDSTRNVLNTPIGEKTFKDLRLDLGRFLKNNPEKATELYNKLSPLLYEISDALGINGFAAIKGEDLPEAIGNLVLIAEDAVKNHYSSDINFKTDVGGFLMKLSTTLGRFGQRPTKFDYLNVNGDNEFALQAPFYLAEFFRGFNNYNNEQLVPIIAERFKDILEDARSNFSNWLWDNNIGDDMWNGIFKHDLNVKDSTRFGKKAPIIGRNGLPLIYGEYIRDTLKLIAIDGVKFIEERLGIKADEVTNDNFDILALSAYILSQTKDYKYHKTKGTDSSERGVGVYLINHSDSPRTHGIKAPVFNVTADTDANGNLVKGSSTMNALLNVMLQDLNEMYLAANGIFDITPEGLKVKRIYDPKNKNNALHNLHKVKHGRVNKDGSFTLIENGVPTGKVFEFNTLTYVNEKGVTITFKDYLATQAGYDTNVYNFLSQPTFEEAALSLQTHMENFIQLAINSRVQADITRLASVKPLMTKYNKRKTLDKTTTEVLIAEKNWDNTIREFSINNFIAQVEIANMFAGHISEYRDSIDFNKRVGQYIKPGQVSSVNKPFTTMVVNDIKLSANKNTLEQLSKILPSHLVDNFRSINATDGFSIITLEHYEDRLRGLGKYYLYKDVIEAIRTGEKFNPLMHSRYLESLKYFYYDRQLSGNEFKDPDAKIQGATPYNYLYSTQIKNSAIVIGPSTFKGSEMNDLYKFMSERGIDEIDFASSQKVTRARPISLFNEDGSLNTNIDNKLVKSSLETKNLSNLRLQQETKPHIIDEVVKLGVQIAKIIFNNINFNHIYTTANGENITGRALFREINDMMSANIRSSAYNLLNKWGAIENGKILQDENGNILVDIRKITAELRRYIFQEGIDTNLYNAISEDENGNSRLPIYAPIHYKKLSSVLLSKFTKEVVDQKLPGIHAPIIPNILMNPSQYITDENKVDTFRKEGSITYLDSIHDDVKAGKRTYELKYSKEYKNGTLVEYVEVLLNPFLSDFFQGNTIIDINEINNQDPNILKMLGMRIPTEGKQSMVVAKVVGFLNNGATTAVFPKEMAPQTGGDYDIDTIYMYHRNIETTVNEFGGVENMQVIPYYTNEQDDARYEAWKQDMDDIRHKQLFRELMESNIEDELDYYNAMKMALSLTIQDKYESKSQYKELEAREKGIIYTSIENLPKRVRDKLKSQEFNKLYEYNQALIEVHRTEYINHIKALETDKRRGVLTDMDLTDLHNLRNEVKRIESQMVYVNDQVKAIRSLVLTLNAQTNMKEKVKMIKNLNEEIDKVRANIKDTSEQYYKEIYNSLPEEEKNSRKARENRMLDLFETILISEEHAGEAVKPNEMLESKEAADMVNDMWNRGRRDLNLYFYADAASIRDMNMSVRQLKANSLGMDATMSVLGVTNGYFQDGVKFTINKSDTNLTFEQLQEVVGKDNITAVNNTYEIEFKHLGNNDAGTWIDITGLKIDNQASQTTSHILDAVTNLMGFNINKHTLGVYKMLAFTPLNILYNGKPNKFIIPNLFVHQPIIVDYAKLSIASEMDSYSTPYSIRQSLFKQYVRSIAENSDIGQYVEKYIEHQIGLKPVKETKEVLTKRYNSYIDKINKNLKLRSDSPVLEFFEGFITFLADMNTGTSVEVLTNNIKDYNTGNPSVETLAYQIKHLDTFISYQNKANSIVGLTATLNQDKKKLGPSTSDTRLMIDKITRYNEKATTNMEIEDSPTILIDGTPALEKILPTHFGLEQESVYPVFETYLEYGAKLAQSVMGSISVLDGATLKEIKDDILSNIPSLKDAVVVDNLINSFAINYLINMPNIFKADTWYDGTDMREAEILVRKRVLGIYDTYEESIVKFRDIIEVGNSLLEEHYDNFKKLSLTNKIALIRKSKRHSSEIFDYKHAGSHILSILELQSDKNHFNRSGGSDVSLIRSDINKEFTIGSFEEILNSPDPFFKDVAVDLLRYAFYKSGFSFGNNLSKFISVDMVTTPVDPSNLDNPLNQIAGYAHQLYAIQDTVDGIDKEDFIKKFLKANADNKFIVPAVTYKQLERIAERKDGDNIFILKVMEFNGRPVAFTIDNIGEIDRSIPNIIGKPYVTFIQQGSKTLMKQYAVKYKGQDLVMHVPIQKHDPYELDFTVYDRNKTSLITPDGYSFSPETALETYHLLPDEATADQFMESITTQPYFIQLYEELYNSEKAQTEVTPDDAGKAYATEINIINTSSQSEAYSELAKTYDTIFYIGKEQGFEYKMFNKIKPLNYINFKNVQQVINEIRLKNDSSRVAIIGNIDAAPDLNTDIIKIVRAIEEQNPNLTSIGTISNSYISSVVKRVSNKPVDNYNSNPNNPSTIAFATETTFGAEQQIRSVTRQKDVLKGMTTNIYKLNQKYSKSAVAFKEDIKKIAKEIAKDNLYEGLERDSIISMTTAISYQVALFGTLIPYIDENINSLKNIKYHKWDEYTPAEQQAKVNLIQELLDIVAVAQNVDELASLHYDELSLTEEEVKRYNKFNELLAELKEVTNQMNDRRKDVIGYAQTYIGAIITARSKRDSFITEFNKKDTDITPDVLISNVNKMLKDNEDISVYQLWLDSAFATGVAAIDNILLEYATLSAQQRRAHHEIVDRMADIIAENFGDKFLLNPEEVKQGKPPRYDRAAVTSKKFRLDRVGLFTRNMFNSKTGTLNTEFKWSEFYDAKKQAMEEVEKELTRIGNDNTLSDKQRNKLRKEAWNPYFEWVKDNMSIYGSEDTILDETRIKELEELRDKISETRFNSYLRQANIVRTYDHTIPYKRGIKRPISYYRVVPKAKYANPGFKGITNAEKKLIEFLQDIPKRMIGEVYNEYGISPDFFPIMQAYETSTVLIENILGWAKVRESKLERGINNELFRVYETPFSTWTEYHRGYEVRNKRIAESEESYEKDILAKVNKAHAINKTKLQGYEKEFKTIKEVNDYNQLALNENKKKTLDKMINDPYDVIYTFSNTVLEHKKIMDFNARLNILRAVMKNEEFELWTTERNKPTKIKGADSNAFKRLEAFSSALHNDSKIKTKIDQLLNLIKQQTSLAYMSLNATGAIKNIMHGFGNEVMEATAGEFTNWSDLMWAMKVYPSLDLISNQGSDYSNNLYTGLIKRFDSILELKRERGFEYNEHDKRVHVLLMATNSLYFMNNITEHFMQYSMMLAMAKSYRVINGKIMNFTQYADNTRLEALTKILSTEQMDSLKAYIADSKAKKEGRRYSDNPDYIRHWIQGSTDGQPNMTMQQRNEYAKVVKEIETKLKQEYDTADRVIDQFEMVEGRAVLKKDAKIKDIDVDYFEKTVHTVNQSLHGIYNRIDRNRLKDTVLGDLAFQFRSWIRPNWNRYFGMRYGRSVWNEAMGSYRKGAYISLGSFLGSPFGNATRMYRSDDISLAQAISSIVSDYGSFIVNLNTHWRELSLQDRQNAKRAMQNLLNITIVGGLLAMITMLSGDDDDEQAYLTALAIYELHATFTETAEFVPIIGWIGTLNRTKQYTMASERVVLEWANILKLMALYPFQDDYSRTFQQGMYKDKNRLFVAMMKNTPLVRQGHKMAYIPAYTSWYKMYNPFAPMSNMFKLKKEDK